MLKSLMSLVDGGLKKVFGTKNERDQKELIPLVDEINAHFANLASLSEAELTGKTDEFRGRLEAGETVDDMMLEAFAVVKEACRRNVGQSWSVVGQDIIWDMVPYDVQLLGAMTLHNGKISEMATGEGKTLVAVLPLYLNALPARGCHLITVNDYLAKRDSEWMGQILRYLGLTVGVIQAGMTPPERREAYNCDVTYGTNNEFGFDYLRDNMANRRDDQVQRGHFYTIVDEVDSVLIDEARTPLIISGPVKAAKQRYDQLRNPVDQLVRAQTALAGKLLNEATTKLDAAAEETDGKQQNKLNDEAGKILLQIQRATPKSKRFLKLIADRNLKPLIHQIESLYMREKMLHVLDDDIYYSIDEREQSLNLSDLGRRHLSPKDPDYFMLPDLAEEIGKIDDDETLSDDERVEKKQALNLSYAEKSDELHTINQLLRAFCLQERDVDYVVQDGKVQIVDEHTGRLMVGRRFSEGLHQAIEAKERVRVEGETQTWATITLQNYFRLYEKLAGMTGTAETEAGEFWEIYKLDVAVIPTNASIRRRDYNDVIYRTRREKFNAIVGEITRLHKNGQPVLVGTVTVETSETISRLLKGRRIPHAVLNAKQHQSEADIVRQAGLPGAVTIATNMAGRGTDIKLGKGVVKGKLCKVLTDPSLADCPEGDEKACTADMPCGLHIIGTERHDSRRIDRQLRGRAGRQGDPGSSRFFLSLEDDLMRLFGGIERMSSLMERIAQEGEVIEHDMITRAIERAQKKVESHHFEIRKQLLEYDNVMNQQREVVYGVRNRILDTASVQAEFKPLIPDAVESTLAGVPVISGSKKLIDYNEEEVAELKEALDELSAIFLVPFPLLPGGIEAPEGTAGGTAIVDKAFEIAEQAYLAREQQLTPPITREVERVAYLKVIDEQWKDHLYEIDLLRGGIGLRAYGQKDPLLEYKAEAFSMFETLMASISVDAVKLFFRIQVNVATQPAPAPAQPQGQAIHQTATGLSQMAKATPPLPQRPPTPGMPRRPQVSRSATGAPVQKPAPEVRAEQKVGRNEPCSCGSGKKYKHCCGKK
jgi:preprotein translocase subunit SecA